MRSLRVAGWWVAALIVLVALLFRTLDANTVARSGLSLQHGGVDRLLLSRGTFTFTDNTGGLALDIFDARVAGGEHLVSAGVGTLATLIALIAPPPFPVFSRPAAPRAPFQSPVRAIDSAP